MNFEKYYVANKTYITHTDIRLRKIINAVGYFKPKNVLDIGCGSGYLLDLLAKSLPSSSLSGVDVYANSSTKKGWKYKKADITDGLPFANNEFDCIILGEVIEHVPNPDFLLREIRRVLKKKGTLIISTPNLVSWANRILVLCGIQPLFTETSSEEVLGRFFKVLGQGGKVQGHLKIFTYKSLEEILVKEKFSIISKIGVPFFFPFPISLFDRLMTRVLPLSSGLLYLSQKN